MSLKGKYKGCRSCWDEHIAEAFRAKEEKRIAEERLAAKEKCIDWVWVVRWTTPTMRSIFSCQASEAYMRVFSCREDALALVCSLRDRFLKIDEELHGHDVEKFGFRQGAASGGGSDEEPDECGNYIDWKNGYSIVIQCRAVNSSPCEFAREYDIDGNPIEKKELAHGCASTQDEEESGTQEEE